MRDRLSIMRFVVGLAFICAGCGSGSLKRWDPPLAVPRIQSELSRELQIDHALSRLTYGARPEDARRVRSIGLERWIAQQLSPERLDDRHADSIVATYRSLGTPTSRIVALFRDTRAQQQQQQRDSGTMRAADRGMDSRRELQQTYSEVASAKLARATVSERQLYEQMVDFWENHFSVFSGKGQTRLFIPAYDRDVIRPRALGRFRDLLGAVATSPAMLLPPATDPMANAPRPKNTYCASEIWPE